ncbi:MAG: S1C family serine protease [Vicinamibacterales bacterium]
MFTQLSNQIADAVAAVAPSVVQVHGGRRPASGLVFADNLVLTTMAVLGREDRAHVRRPDGSVLEGQLTGWDPATRVALLRVPELGLEPVIPGGAEPRVGHIAVAIARSWSNAVTATAGLVSVIGGPLPTGRRRAIERVIRTSAPMHDGFAGGAFLDSAGQLIGVTTAAEIRGLGVVIPAPIAWASAARVLERSGIKRGYLGIAVQPVRVSQRQVEVAGRDAAVLIAAVKDGSPAANAGVLVGDLLLSVDGHSIASPEELLDLLDGERVGHSAELKILRGDTPVTLSAVIAERP